MVELAYVGVVFGASQSIGATEARDLLDPAELLHSSEENSDPSSLTVVSNRKLGLSVAIVLLCVGCGAPRESEVETSDNVPASTTTAPPATTINHPDVERNDSGYGYSDEMAPSRVRAVVRPEEWIKGFAVAQDGTTYFGVVPRTSTTSACTATLYRIGAQDVDRERVGAGVWPAIDAQGSTLAYVASQPVDTPTRGIPTADSQCIFDEIVIRDLATSTEKSVVDGDLDRQRGVLRSINKYTVRVEGLQWSPNGSQLAFLLQGGLASGLLFDRATGRTTAVQSPTPLEQPIDTSRWAPVRAMRWLPNGDLVARVACATKGCPVVDRPDTAFQPDPGWVYVRNNAVGLPFERVENSDLLAALCAYSRPNDCGSQRVPSTPTTTTPTTTATTTTTRVVAASVNLGTADENAPSSITQLVSPNEALLGYAIAPDGTRYFATVDTTVRGRDCNADLLRVRRGSVDRERIAAGIWPALTPDGSTLAFAAPTLNGEKCTFERLVTMDTNSGETRTITGGALAERTAVAHQLTATFGSDVIESLQWSPDSTKLKFLFTIGTLPFGLIYERATGQTLIVDYPKNAAGAPPSHVALLRALRWLPDGTLAARLMCQRQGCPREPGAASEFMSDPGWVRVHDNAVLPPYNTITDNTISNDLCSYSRPSDCSQS